jgi:hypothetical protein
MALALVPMAASTAPASACLNAVETEVDKDLAVVKVAEQHVSNGKLLPAAINVKKAMPDVRERSFTRGNSLSVAFEFTEAAVRTMALVTVRTGGAWLYKKKGTYVLAVPDEKSRVENLEWAVESLRLAWLPRRRGMDFDDPPPPKAAQPDGKPAAPANPRDASNLAEALSLLPEHQAEARRILEDLAAKDLVTSAYAYAALARLRAIAPDEGGAKAALQQCRVLGGKRARSVCVPDEPKPKLDPTVGESAPRAAARS